MLASKIVTSNLGSIMETYLMNYKIVTEDTKFVKEDISWRLVGEIPKDIFISNGIVMGRVQTFEDQNLPASDFYPKEKTLLDGSNYDKIGRYKYSNKVYNFKVERTYTTYQVEDIVTEEDTSPIVTKEELLALYTLNTQDKYLAKLQELIEDPNVKYITYGIETIASDLTLTVIKNGDVTTKKFMISYLETDITYIDTEQGRIPYKHSITHNGKEYTFDNIEEFKKEY